MKKALLLLALLTGSAYSGFGKIIITTKCDGGKGGYDIVNESHNNDTDIHALTCINPGSNNCGWCNTPLIKMTEVDQLVELQIMSGVLEGSLNTLYGTVSWKGTSIYNCTYQLETAPEL